MSLRIESPGAFTTVQDLGRFGHEKDAFGRSGAMDVFSVRYANRLLENTDDCAVLEMTLLGIRARAEKELYVAFAGGDFPLKINGREAPSRTVLRLGKGDVFECGAARAGCRGYLAVRGGFTVPPVLGSRSTNLRCAAGGFHGRKLAAGDVVPADAPQEGAAYLSGRTFPAPPERQTDPCRLRVLFGPQDGLFSAEEKERFLSEVFRVTPLSDRMGIRLAGRAVRTLSGSADIVSDGIVPGAVQIPKDGQPIVLAADCQTTGGYAKIACVISADLPALGQLRPGDPVRFAPCTRRAAVRALRRMERDLPMKIRRMDE